MCNNKTALFAQVRCCVGLVEPRPFVVHEHDIAKRGDSSR